MDRALLLVNPQASGAAEHKDEVVEALSDGVELEVTEPDSPGHATELAREAGGRGLDVVVALGGDGSMNAVANGLVGTETAMAPLPGGMANVMCKTLGLPGEVVEAARRVRERMRAGSTRRINVGRLDEGQYFTMSCGAGLDAATVKRVEDNPDAKRRFGELFFVASLVPAIRETRQRGASIHLEAGDESADVVLAVVVNIPELTYLKKWPLTVAPDASMDKGLDVVAMRQLPLAYVPVLFWSLFRSGSHVRHEHTVYESDLPRVRLSSRTGDSFPVQIDGDFLGDRTELDVELVRDALTVLA